MTRYRIVQAGCDTGFMSWDGTYTKDEIVDGFYNDVTLWCDPRELPERDSVTLAYIAGCWDVIFVREDSQAA